MREEVREREKEREREGESEGESEGERDEERNRVISFDSDRYISRHPKREIEMSHRNRRENTMLIHTYI